MPLLFDKTQNRVVDVDDRLVNEALASGNYEFRSGVRIPVVAPNGEQGTVLSDEMGELIGKGFRYLTSKEGKERAKQEIGQIREEEYGDRTGLALGLGALRGASLGLSDVALRAAGELTGAQVDQALLETRNRNEVASLIGEIGGGIGAFALPSSGLAGLGTALGVIGAPSRAAVQVGQRLAPLTTGVGRATRGGRFAQAGAAGTLEGAAIGVGQTISEAAMADPELTAEKALANIGLGAVFGGTLSALGRGALETADVSIQKSLRTLAKTKLPKTAEEFSDSLSEIYGKALNISRGNFKFEEEALGAFARGKAEQRASIINNIADGQGLYEKISKRFDVVRDFAERLKKDSSRVANLQKEILDEEIGNQIENQTKKIFGKDLASAEKAYQADKFMAAKNKAAELVKKTEDLLKNAAREEEEFGKMYRASSLNQITIAKEELRQSAQNATKISEIADAINSAKQRIANSTPMFTKRLDNLKDTNRMEYDTVIKLKPLWKEYKSASVDEKVFGNLGVAFAERAENLSALTSAVRNFDKNFFEYVDRPGGPQRLEDFTKIANFFRNPEAISKAKNRRALAEFSGTVDDVIKRLKPIDDVPLNKGIEKLKEALKKTGDTPDAADTRNYLQDKIKRLEAQKAKISEFNEEMKEVIESAIAKKKEFDEVVDIAIDDRAAAQFLQSLESYTGKSLYGIQLGKTLGGGIAGALGVGAAVDETSPIGSTATMAGALAGALLANPTVGLKIIAGLDNAALGLDKAARKSAVRFRNVSKKLEKEKGKLKALVVAGRQATIRSQLRLDPEDRSENNEKAFLKHKERLDELASDPVGLYETIFDSMGENAASEVPISMQSMFSTTARGVAFLQEKIPRDPFANPVLPDKYKPSFAELDKYSRYVQAVKNPKQIFRELESGVLRPETVEAVKSVYPNVYQAVVENVAAELMQGDEIPFQARVQLSVLLDVPAVKSLTPEYMQTLIQSEQQRETEQPRRSPQAGQMTQSQIVSFRDVNVSGREQE